MSLPHYSEIKTENINKYPVWLQQFRVIFTDRLAVQNLFEGVNMTSECFRLAINTKKKQLLVDYNESRDTFLQHKLAARLSSGEVIQVGDLVVELHTKEDVIFQRSHFGGVTLENVHLDTFSWGAGQSEKYSSAFSFTHESIAEGQLVMKYKTWRVEQLPPKN